MELSALWDTLPDYARNLTEAWMNTISISTQHPNSEICIQIMHKSEENPTTSSYDNLNTLSIDCAIISIHHFHLFMTRSVLVSSLSSFIYFL